jgi:ATP-dependent RNA helicase DHX57
VVLATNVAETSITIDDVGFVIDSGRVKEERYEVSRRMSSLQDVLISAAAAKQRRGRAGRVQHGLCMHLFSSDTKLAAYTEPEVCRVALEQLVMRTKSLRLPGRADESSGRLPDPPSRDAVAAAVAELSSLGALDSDECLTPMGQVHSPPLFTTPGTLPSSPLRVLSPPDHLRAPCPPRHLSALVRA